MSTWQGLLRLFYKYEAQSILYIKEGKLYGYIEREKLLEQLSDLSNIKFDPLSVVQRLDNLETAIAFVESGVKGEEEKKIPVVNKRFEFVGLWNRVDVIKSWEEVPSISAWKPDQASNKEHITSPKHPSDRNKTKPPSQNKDTAGETDPKEQDIILQKMILLAVETLPIALLAIDTSGNEIFYNEDWLNFKQSYPKPLKTQNILKRAKELTMKAAFSEKELNLNQVFHLEGLLPKRPLEMKLIRNQNKTVGYLFWEVQKKEQPDSKTPKNLNPSYKGKKLNELLAKEEKKILAWAMQETDGHRTKAADILGIPRQTFGYRYNKYFNLK